MTIPSRPFYDVRTSRAAWLSALALSASVFLGSRPASAQVTSSYEGARCQPATSGSWSGFTNPTIADGIQATSTGGGGWVICPITKTTSGPGIFWGDEISDVEVTLDNHGGATGIYCQVVVYNSQVPLDVHSDTNVEHWGWSQTETADTGISWSDGIDGSAWWGDTSWSYAQLECLLQENEELIGYEVTENGSPTGQFTSPISDTCSPDSSTHFQVNPTQLLPWNGEGSMGYGEAPGGATVKYDCSTPHNYYQYSMVPAAIDAAAWEWSFNSSGFGSPASWTCTFGSGSPAPVTGPAHFVFPGPSSGSPQPSAVFPSSTFEPPSANKTTKWTGEGEWLDTSSTSHVFFTQCTNEGDFGIASYRSSN